MSQCSLPVGFVSMIFTPVRNVVKIPISQFLRPSELLLLLLSSRQGDIPSHLSNLELTHRTSLHVA